MEANTELVSGDLSCRTAEGSPPVPELRSECSGAGNDGGTREERTGVVEKPDPGPSSLSGLNGARYKSMSPARLPIVRSPCVTIPPGFSPSSLLESPVLITNRMAEPSPTTGTFNMPSILGKNAHLGTSMSPIDISNLSSSDEGNSRAFEFKPHVKASYNISSSSLRPLISSQSLGQSGFPSKNESAQLVGASTSAIEASTSAACPPVKTDFTETQQAKWSDQSADISHSDMNEPIIEKSAEDGYNWRKYGQKHVKGSEYPRSYYKCTHPNCQMKKQIERSHDGKITEIIYRGQHDHPKPQINRRSAIGSMSNQEEENSPIFYSLVADEDKSENVLCQISQQVDPNGASEMSPASISEHDVKIGGGQSNNCDEIVGDGDPESKRRKMESAYVDSASIGKLNREPRVVVQTVSEVDILDDGYRWRKYGQKVVKGNPNPRSYYKCTNVGCPVRKHVERASHDPKAVITTYEGKHNHDVPAARLSNQDASMPSDTNDDSSMSTLPRNCSTRTPVISLDLGVGIIPCLGNITNGEHQFLEIEQKGGATQATSLYHDTLQPRISESGENTDNRFTFKANPINPSNMYYTTPDNLVMGP
ncbi:WRKY transcription factor SUSIBA2-like [Curcuma longa]|uniref:WRKY transcription factor SUSIBA2-like n=1 Tax=Curcuma longa TaxID=136217 RepID=UPI003D9E6D51